MSIYWLWLAVIAAVLANVPVVPYDSKSSPCYRPITFLYKDTIAKADVASWKAIGDDKLILLHAVVSVVVTIVAMGIHRAWTVRGQNVWHESHTFTLGGVVVAAVVLSLIFTAFIACNASYVLYAVVLIFFTGRLVAASLIGNRSLTHDTQSSENSSAFTDH